MATKSETKGAQPPVDLERLERERQTVKALLEEAISPAVPRLTRTERGRLKPVHPEPQVGFALIMQAIGTSDGSFLDGLLDQLIELSMFGGMVDLTRVNFILSVIKGIAPRDQIETMHAFQMAAVHMEVNSAASRLWNPGDRDRFARNAHELSQLAKTFALQMEALKRYRTGGEQKITVQYVSVAQGAQAIVGDVTHVQQDKRLEVSNPPQSLIAVETQPLDIDADRKPPALVPRRRRNRSRA